MKITVETPYAEAVRAKEPGLPEKRLRSAIREYYAYRDQCELAGDRDKTPGVDKILEFAEMQLMEESGAIMKKRGYCKAKNGLMSLISSDEMRKITGAIGRIRSRGDALTLAGFAREMHLGTDTTDKINHTRSKAARKYLKSRGLLGVWKGWVKLYGCGPQKESTPSKTGSLPKNEKADRMIAD